MLTEHDVKGIVAKTMREQAQAPPRLTEDQIKDIVRTTVETTLTTLGINHQDPIEMQADFAHLRRWRKATNQATNLGFITLVTTITAGVLGAIWLGFQTMVGK